MENSKISNINRKLGGKGEKSQSNRNKIQQNDLMASQIQNEKNVVAIEDFIKQENSDGYLMLEQADEEYDDDNPHVASEDNVFYSNILEIEFCNDDNSETSNIASNNDSEENLIKDGVVKSEYNQNDLSMIGDDTGKAKGSKMKTKSKQKTIENNSKSKNKIINKNKGTVVLDELFKCDLCEYKTANKYLLRNHLDIHKGNKKFSCDQCSYTCTLSTYLHKHKKTHLSFKPYACNKCDFTCKTTYSLREHHTRHNKVKNFKCSQCDYSTTHLAYLKRHFVTHDINKKTLTCDFCEFRCRWNCQMKVHLLNHSGQKPFSCDLCDFVCKTKAHLKQHSNIHKTDEVFACDICPYKGSSILYLKKHMFRHFSDKYYECDKCCYKTKLSFNLKKHVKTHEKDGKF